MSIWRPRWGGGGPDLSRCRASVPDGGRSPTFHQCSRKATIFRQMKEGEIGFCRTHDPVAVEERRAIQREQWDREWAASEERRRHAAQYTKAKEDCIAALRQIEAGHNDPRAVAREALARLDECAETPNTSSNTYSSSPPKEQR